MTKLPISVFIICQNEEQHIRRLLTSLEMMDEIIIVDSGSTDMTLEIAREYDVKITHQEWLGYTKQKQFAMNLCSHDWVLNLDADEALTPTLVAKMEAIIKSDDADCVRLPRNDFFIGQPFSTLTKKPNNLRFFKKSNAQFKPDVLVHESAQVDGREIQIKEAFDHFGYDSIHVLTDKCNQYSTLKADEKFAKGKRHSLLKLTLVFPIIFLNVYLLQRFIFSGRRGFIQSVITAYYSFIKEAKLYEAYQREKPHRV